jgi:hypothetical protein
MEQKQGIPWDFHCKSAKYDVILRTPVLLIIGDNEGAINYATDS